MLTHAYISRLNALYFYIFWKIYIPEVFISWKSTYLTTFLVILPFLRKSVEVKRGEKRFMFFVPII